MFKHQAIATVASAVAVASLAFAGVTVTTQHNRPESTPDTSELQAANDRAQLAEAERDNLAAQLAQASQDARYTACMYALNTLNPRSDMTAAAWSCQRNLDTFAVLTPGQAWDAREYNER